MSMSKSSPRKVKAAEVKQQVIDLRRSGHLYTEIAPKVGVSRQRCQQIVRAYLEETHRLCTESIERLRQQELERLDTMQAAVWPKVQAGEIKAIECAVKIAHFRSRLLGLEAPRRIDQTTTFRGLCADLTDAELIEQAERAGLPIPDELRNPPTPDTIPFPNRAG